MCFGYVHFAFYFSTLFTLSPSFINLSGVERFSFEIGKMFLGRLQEIILSDCEAERGVSWAFLWGGGGGGKGVETGETHKYIAIAVRDYASKIAGFGLRASVQICNTK